MDGPLPDNTNAVSWGAILAGAACGAALAFLLVLLGFGFGLSAVSPWSGAGASLETIGVSAIIWLVIVQLAASGLAGYIAGRLRTKWPGTHTHEVYFRDTAHGLITWAVATVLVVAFMASAIQNLMESAAEAGAEFAGGNGVAGDPALQKAFESPDYFVDVMLRSEDADLRADEATRQEVLGILVWSLREGELRAEDRRYLAHVVARNSELEEPAALERVEQVFQNAEEWATDALQMVDDLRSATARTALWMAFALLCGAFVASFMATFGGRQRDAVQNII